MLRVLIFIKKNADDIYQFRDSEKIARAVKKQFQADFAWTCEWTRINKQESNTKKNFIDSNWCFG